MVGLLVGVLDDLEQSVPACGLFTLVYSVADHHPVFSTDVRHRSNY